MYEAKIIKDSICNGHRLTTMQLTHPRIVHAEFNTHCMFARNASSSRAIPFATTVKRVTDDPFIPVWWGKNQKGMQAAEQLGEAQQQTAIRLWLHARDYMIDIAERMASAKCTDCDGTGKVFEHDITTGHHNTVCSMCQGTGEGLNVHKQIVNRLLEPFSWITVAVTGDWSAWSNYFALRCHPDAQPEIQKQAYMAQKAYFESTPQEIPTGGWHLPYIKPEEFEEIAKWVQTAKIDAPHPAWGFVQISTGRCARTSYLTQEGTREFDKDIELHDRLRFHTPLHASPFEHVCEAMGNDKRYAKYVGWKSYRYDLPKEYVTDFKPNHPELVNAQAQS
jgi:hypothetical protein